MKSICILFITSLLFAWQKDDIEPLNELEPTRKVSGLDYDADDQEEVQEIIRASNTINKLSGKFAIDSMTNILLEAFSLASSNDQVRLIFNIAKFKRFLGQYDSVEWYLDRMRGILDQIKEPFNEGEHLYYMRSGIMFANLGDFSKSLVTYQKALDFASNKNQKTIVYLNLGILYRTINDLELSKEKFTQALNLSESESLKAGSMQSIGQIWLAMNQPDSALSWFEKAETLEMMDQTKVWLHTNKSKIYLERQNDKEAAESLSIIAPRIYEMGATKEILTHFWAVAGRILSTDYAYILQQQIGNINSKEAFEKSLANAAESKDISYKIWSREYIAKEYLKMNLNNLASKLLMEAIDLKNLEYEGARMNAFKMGFRNQMLADSLAQVEEKRIVEEAHQKEVLAKEKQRNIFLGSGLLVLVFTGGLWSRLSYIRRSKAVLQIEKDKSENLLLNILPAEVAEELKANGKAQARDFDLVSILFTDFKEFTQTSEKLSAGELVGEINYCFEGFDAIMEKYGIEKIKTIGDAYMAAGGLPVLTPESPKDTVQAALEMCKFIARRKQEREAAGKVGFEMRCGIHTGPVVAGIVGVKKFQYDIWGDTVNTANRMESNGEVGMVNISQYTYELINNEENFSFEKRGKIEVKGKGEMNMYFVENVAA